MVDRNYSGRYFGFYGCFPGQLTIDKIPTTEIEEHSHHVKRTQVLFERVVVRCCE